VPWLLLLLLLLLLLPLCFSEPLMQITPALLSALLRTGSQAACLWRSAAGSDLPGRHGSSSAGYATSAAPGEPGAAAK
jgi:hypothetical protein